MAERFTEQFLDELRSAVRITDLVGQYVLWENGKGRDGDRWACCPFHGESTPSFHATDDKKSYHCFGCGVSGDHFKFLTESQGMTFPESVQAVAELAGIPLPDGLEVTKGKSRVPEQPRAQKSPPQASAVREGRVPVNEYPYTDNDGNLLYDVVRFQIRLPDGSWARNKDGTGIWKTFLHRRPSGLPDGSKVWGVKAGDYIRPGPGKDWSPWKPEKADNWPNHEVKWFDEVETTIYRHPAVEIAIAEGRPVFIVEGEKDAETVEELGLCGTTNSAGSQHWTDAHSANFRGADVVLCLDNDEAGNRTEKVARSLKGVAKRIRVLDFSQVIEGFPAKGDITDWVKQFGGTTDELEKIIAGLPDWRPRKPEGFGGRAFSDISDKPIEYDWLIKNLVERNGVVILAGEKQAGKTFAALDMGMKVARGLPYGGKKTRQGVVIHIAIEDGRGVRMRAEGYRRFNDISPDQDIPYIVMDREFSLMSDDAVNKLIQIAHEWADYYGMPVELIIIDTWSVATEGLNEIDGAEVGKVLARINRLKDETGATICLVHHMNASGSRVRGHTSIEANVSNVIEIKPAMTIPDNRRDQPRPILDAKGRHVRYVTLTKNKNGLNNIKWKLSLEVVHLGVDADGDPITTCVCVPVARNEAQAPKERRSLSPDQKLVYDALLAALEDRGTDMPAGVRAGPQVKRAVSQQDFVGYVRKQMTFSADEEEIEARNKELGAFLKRTTTSLINAGYMGRDNDKKVVWSLGRQVQEPEPPRDQPEPPPAIPDDVKNEMEGLPDEPPF